MIARIWQGKTSTVSEEGYLQHLERTVFPYLTEVDGYHGASVLRRETDDGVEFVVVTWWETLEAVQGFAGNDIDTAVVPPEAQALLEEWAKDVKHYEVVAGREP